MNYQWHYDRLVERARHRKLSGYSERHHVVPKCLGGSDDKENLVRLTAEEHYVAHQLLVKIFPWHHGLLWAAVSMTNGTRLQAARASNKLYGWLRRKFACENGDRSRGRKASIQARARMSAARVGVKRGPHASETKMKMSAASKGRAKSLKHREALAASKLGRKRGPHSELHKQRIAESNREKAKVRDFSYLQKPEYRETQRQKSLEMWAKRRAGILPMPRHLMPVEV